MTYIAFKRFKNVEPAGRSLHPDYIVEHADTQLYPPEHHKPEDGWEILPVDEFEADFALNPIRHSQFAEQVLLKEKAAIDAEKAAAIKSGALNKNQDREYAEFLRWKRAKKITPLRR